MRYNLGFLDKYPIEAAGSCIEHSPMLRAFFKEPVEGERLEDAVKKAITVHPLFGTRIGFDGEYYLETNDNPVKIFNCREEDREHNYGTTTNGYPWRITYYDRTVCLEWMHGVTDGLGACEFLKQVLMCYFGDEPDTLNRVFPLEPGLEPFFDKKEKGTDYSTTPSGYNWKKFPLLHDGYKSDCHRLRADTSEILALAHECRCSVVPALIILYSQALRLHLPKDMKNRNVACNIALDLRRILGHQTMHNCINTMRFTYTDEHDKMSFPEVAQDYKATLDKARLRPNIIRSLSERIKLLKLYHLLPYRWWLHMCTKAIGRFLKSTDCNIGFSYLGKIDLPAYVTQNLENFDFKCWHDFGNSFLSCLDYEGQFNMNIVENYAEKGIVEDFIKLSAAVGIHWTETEFSVFEQAHFEENL